MMRLISVWSLESLSHFEIRISLATRDQGTGDGTHPALVDDGPARRLSRLVWEGEGSGSIASTHVVWASFKPVFGSGYA